ncbi:E3 ubiquitin-protein ligase TRAIP-like [Chelonus insularis]|uniref:E3 ubiquitin-protein ligase TRAIP-like n=1 Tax=Chelonus insularis TaxID=460826 RepID=UPI001589704E|nr:E3 ubiquitin-protein ligase TRAIP-like [Chelonus insularis]
MNGQCSICCAIFQSSDELCSPLCGHVFHFSCLFQWLERSKTCPQCRQKTNCSQVHRLYIQTGKNLTQSEDSAVLQERLDNLEFKMKLKETDLNHYKNESQKLKKQAVELRKEVHKLESEINLRKNHIAALQEQNKYLKDISVENETLKNDNSRLKKQLKDIEDVKNILTASNDEVNEMIDSTNDRRKLGVYISVLKRELTLANSIRKEYRDKIKQLKSQLNKYETEKVAGLIEQENPNKHKEIEIPIVNLDDPIELNENTSSTHLKVHNLRDKEKRKLTVQQNSSVNLPENSILAKKRRLLREPLTSKLTNTESSYKANGLGGFSKIEHFPIATGKVKK